MPLGTPEAVAGRPEKRIVPCECAGAKRFLNELASGNRRWTPYNRLRGLSCEEGCLGGICHGALRRHRLDGAVAPATDCVGQLALVLWRAGRLGAFVLLPGLLPGRRLPSAGGLPRAG